MATPVKILTVAITTEYISFLLNNMKYIRTAELHPRSGGRTISQLKQDVFPVGFNQISRYVLKDKFVL